MGYHSSFYSIFLGDSIEELFECALKWEDLLNVGALRNKRLDYEDALLNNSQYTY